ncbi:MAG: hypothetical protein CTY15_03105 [Methylocystis sp.]|nr:MAG: hypothetical protein CTY15_03105 [Methylocystis sp.]
MEKIMDDNWSRGVETTVEKALDQIPYIGEFLSAIVQIFWPQTKQDVWSEIKDRVEDLLNSKLSAAAFNRVQASLGTVALGDGLYGVVADYTGSVDKLSPNGQDPQSTWTAANIYFIGASAAFQQQGDEILLLPLYAQMANLHLGLLRDGVLGKFCNLNELQTHLNNYGAYVDKWVAAAIAASITKATSQNGTVAFNPVNKVKRFMQLNVLNFRELWKYFDPVKYPGPISFITPRTEVFYAATEIFNNPTYGTHLNPPGAPTLVDLASIDLFVQWDDPSSLATVLGADSSYQDGTTTPYSGTLYLNQPPPKVPPPQNKYNGSINLYYQGVKVPSTNPIVAVDGQYDSTGGVYYVNFTFQDKTQTGQIPTLGATHYPNVFQFAPPEGYFLSSVSMNAGGWYYSASDAIFGFRKSQ